MSVQGKVAAKIGAKGVPLVGQALAVAEASPVAVEEAKKYAATTAEGVKTSLAHLRKGELLKAAKSGARTGIKSQVQFAKGSAKVLVAGVAAKELVQNPAPMSFDEYVAWRASPRFEIAGMMAEIPRLPADGLQTLIDRGHPMAWMARYEMAFRKVVKNPRAAKRNPAPSDVGLYQDILALLRAIHWKAWTLHWQASGPNYYGDHLLLQRLYAGEGGGPNIEASIDALGERMVVYFGPDSVNPTIINAKVGEVLEGKVGFAGLLALEELLQRALRAAWKSNQEAKDSFSLGMDDYLMALANERDTAIYLIRRRLG